jgi:hypothetical protein
MKLCLHMNSLRHLASRRTMRLTALGAVWFCLTALCFGAESTRKTRNVFLIVSDGLRWQEVFTGAEAALMTTESGGVKATNALRKEFWRETPEARREALMPFFWTEIARHGQLFGNQTKGNVVKVTNGKNFSYPGYNEMLTGAGDPRIDSNDKKPNPNVTVFEWLNAKASLRGHVAALGTWDVFPYIFNVQRSHIPIWPGAELAFEKERIQSPAAVVEFMRDTTALWENVTYDSFLIHTATDYVKQKQPRLMFVGFGETDEWAHAGRYDYYLTAANHVDRFVRRLWELTQSHPQYRGTTTFVITADHGRGTGLEDWKSHSEKIARSESDWIAVIGPDTPALGERTGSEPHTISQVAATIAALLGEDYVAAFPGKGAPIRDVIAANP